ncbi:MAG: hypothetical protein JW900_01545 [Anaerolineae bacterium]|nr:hypothetical protein [Anaerolineae bacterium]
MSDELADLFGDKLYFNGIDGVTGEYALPPMSPQQLARIIKGEPAAGEPEADDEHLSEMREKRGRRARMFDEPAKEGVDAADLGQAGWAVILPADMDPGRRETIKEALAPLLQRRLDQAGERLFRLFEGESGYQPGERKSAFFRRQTPEVRRGPADPEQLPFYVLLVGSPLEIPYFFQYELDLMRGVGRLDFGDDWDAYAQYAANVVAAESGQVQLDRQAAFWGVANPGDRATELSSTYMIQPLIDHLQQQQRTGEIPLEWAWRLAAHVGPGQATRARLGDLLGGDPQRTPALLMTASHGVEFPLNHAQQFAHQGALLGQEWPGPGHGIGRAHYFAAEDVPQGNVLGMVALFFACYGAGTPQFDQFVIDARRGRPRIAPHEFTAALPNQLLRRGALAVLGHVERAWGYSFLTESGAPDIQAFETALRKLMNGEPVGLATDPSFGMRYADMAAELGESLKELRFDDAFVSDRELVRLWTATNDARGYVVLGDPAVSIPFARDGAPPERPPLPEAGRIAPPKAGERMGRTGVSPAVDLSAGADPFVAMRPQLGDLTASLGQFAQQLSEALQKAADKIATLEVRTYTAPDLETIARQGGEKKLRAFTRIKFDGSVEAYLPDEVEESDPQVWQLHREMVRDAQANRAHFLQTMTGVATDLLNVVRP